MADGAEQSISLQGLFSRAFGDADELLSQASGDTDVLLSQASGDTDVLLCPESCEADESFCDPCKSVGNLKAVEGYCPVCDEYLCKTCNGVHQNQKITRAHVILDKKQMPRGRVFTDNQVLCVGICKIHHPEIIRFYCKTHDQPGCGDCMTINHTACQINRVSDISGGFQNTDEFKDIDQKLQQLHNELEKMGDDLNNDLKNLNTTYNSVLDKITSVRKQINVYLDEIERKITEEAAQMKKDDETKLKTMQAENEAMKAETAAMLQVLHGSNVNVNSLFVITKHAKQRLGTMEKSINEMKPSQEEWYGFVVSKEIGDITSAKTPLGKLSRNMLPSTTTNNRTINVKGKEDQKTCGIKDCTLLGADRMVLTDDVNRNVKLIDLSNNTVISSYSLSNPPWGVTALGTNLIAVALPGKSKIHLLNVTSTFTLQRKIKVNRCCFGIAYKGGKFAVSYMDPGGVEIIDIHGNILHEIQPKQDKKHTLNLPYSITFGHDNDTVIVSDHRTQQVSVLTFSGQILHTYKHSMPTGIEIGADGVLFVCWMDGVLYAVSPQFKLRKYNIALYSWSMTYCEISRKLYISTSTDCSTSVMNNLIQVYDLHA